MDMTKKIRTAIRYGGVTQQQLAEIFDTSQANISQRIRRGVFPVNDLELIADACGAELVCYFEFPDGTKI